MMKYFAILFTSLVASVAWAQNQPVVELFEQSPGCYAFKNLPASVTKVLIKTKGTNGWAQRKPNGPCYKPIWKDGKATISFKLLQGRKALTTVKHKDVTQPAATSVASAVGPTAPPVTPTGTVTIEEHQQCLTARDSARVGRANAEAGRAKAEKELAQCLLQVRQKVCPGHWSCGKEGCRTHGTRLGLVWSGRVCKCKNGQTWVGGKNGRCRPGAGSMYVDPKLLSLLPRIEELEKSVKVINTRLDGHDKRLKDVEDKVAKIGTGAPASGPIAVVDQTARDKAEEARKMAEAALRRDGATPVTATTEAECTKKGGTWNNGVCLFERSRFQFVPALGFSVLVPSGQKSQFSLYIDAEMRLWGTDSFAAKLSTGLGLGFEGSGSLNWTVAGGVEHYFDDRKRFGVGFSLRYWSYNLSAKLKVWHGRALMFLPGFFAQLHKNVRLSVEPGPAMYFLDGKIMAGFAINAMIGFSIPGR